MATFADAQDALKALLVGFLYPNGTSQPSAFKSGGAPQRVAVMRGWPTQAQIQKDLAADLVVVSITPQPNGDRETTPGAPFWRAEPTPGQTMTATLSSSTPGAPRAFDCVTVGGVAGGDQTLVVNVDGRSYATPIATGALPGAIAAAMAAAISEDRPASSAGAAISIPGAHGLSAAVATLAVKGLWRELRRTQHTVQIALWCASPEVRDDGLRFLEPLLSGAGTERGHRSFLHYADGSRGRLAFVGSNIMDDGQLAGLFRANLLYSLETSLIEFADGVTIAEPKVDVVRVQQVDGVVLPVLSFL